MPLVKKPDLLFPELSYKIIGCAYDVYNQLALIINFGNSGVTYKRIININQ